MVRVGEDDAHRIGNVNVDIHCDTREHIAFTS